MTDETQSPASQSRGINLSPWLVVLAALVVYGITMDHWLSLNSLSVVSSITGWDWHPLPLPWRGGREVPLYLVLTAPVRILPGTWQPFLLNALSTLCAALTLGLLAASVRLLPHDRTREQRQREGGEFSLLSIPLAFIPPLFAVLMLGMQLTFWRNAMAACPDTLDGLVFAFLIYCLLRYRIVQRDGWLYLFAFVYGLGVTNNWGLIGFFPLFLTALVWIKWTGFFNWRFLGMIAACGVAGLLLYLLIPILGAFGPDRGNFLNLLHQELGAQWFLLRRIPGWVALVASVPTVVPLIFAGIRWPSFEGEVSAVGNSLTRLMFRFLHFFFLLLALILFFELRFSPSQRLSELPGVGFMSFYYISALCVGYFSGYLLLVFGKSGQGDKRLTALRAVNHIVLALAWVVMLAAPCYLFYQNFPRFKAHQSDILARLADEWVRELPDTTVVILSDDAERLNLLQAGYARAGKPLKHILIDTGSFPHRDYIRSLVARYPQLKKLTKSLDNAPPVFPSQSLVQYMAGLAQDYPLFYLNPSFGYFFENFYLEPAGLTYTMHLYQDKMLFPPALTARDLAANKERWSRIEKNVISALPAHPQDDPTSLWVAGHLSVGLDSWGVQLQKANALKDADTAFKEAARLNPLNYVAQINDRYNAHLQQNNPAPVDSSDLVVKAVNQYHGAVPILSLNGPVDEPGLDLEFGQMLALGKNYRQAAILFNRRLQLLPSDVPAQMDLTKTYVDSGHAELALKQLQELRANPQANQWEVSRIESLAHYYNNDYPTAERLLLKAVNEKPADENRLETMAEFYMDAAKRSLAQTNKPEANVRFENCLKFLDKELAVLGAPGHSPNPRVTVPAALLRKAEAEMMLESYDRAVSTLNRVLALERDNRNALLNRAVAEIELKQYKPAEDDYHRLEKLLPEEPWVIEMGLAEIAHRSGETQDEIRHLQRYLLTAPKRTRVYVGVQQRLKTLQGK